MPKLKPSSKPKPAPLRQRLTDETGLERLIFFSDAVFAIAITLLVLDIRLPDLSAGGVASAEASPNNAQLLALLLSLRPHYLAYAISFLVIGLFWMNHHRRFRQIHAYDRRLILLNLLLLMVVAFLPFPTTVISRYANATGVIFYAISVALVGLLGTLEWVYAGWAGLVDPRLPPAQIRREALRGLIVSGLFLLTIPIALLNPDWAMYSWILAAVIWRLVGSG